MYIYWITRPGYCYRNYRYAVNEMGERQVREMAALF